MTENQVALIMSTIEEAQRCPNYCADASAGEEPCDGLDGCQKCLELAAKEVLGALSLPEVVDVVAAVRRDRVTGRYWLCRRNADGAHGGLAGMWEYPGGRVEAGEQLREALRREMDEEFGVSATVGAVLDSIETFQESDGTRYRVTFLEVEMPDPAELRKHTEARWMTPAEACQTEHLSSGTIFNARHLATVEPTDQELLDAHTTAEADVLMARPLGHVREAHIAGLRAARRLGHGSPHNAVGQKPPSVTLSAERLLAIHDALIEKDVDEAYHQLYGAVEPTFTVPGDPFARFRAESESK